MTRRLMAVPLVAVTLLLGVATRVPAALAFPYRAQVGSAAILSDVPIDPLIGVRLARADRLLAQAGIVGTERPHQIVLTDGGWRWHVLTLTSSGAFGIRRPLSNALVFNRSDVATDRVFNGRAIGGERTLSGTIAHEMTHWLMAERLGELSAATQPAWKWEGFADYVAQESSLSNAEAAHLRPSEPDAPALRYYDARRRVAAQLARDDSIERLFDDQ